MILQSVRAKSIIKIINLPITRKRYCIYVVVYKIKHVNTLTKYGLRTVWRSYNRGCRELIDHLFNCSSFFSIDMIRKFSRIKLKSPNDSFLFIFGLISRDERTQKATVLPQRILQLCQALRTLPSSWRLTLRAKFCHHWSQQRNRLCCCKRGSSQKGQCVPGVQRQEKRWGCS